MKKSFLKYISIVAILVGVACNESEDLVTDGAQIGGLIDASSTSLNYVVGNPDGPYTMEFFVHQGKTSVKSMKLYKSFTSTVKYTEMVEGEEVEKDTTFTSNEVLDRTIDITEAGNHFTSTDYTLTELIEGLEVASLTSEAKPLPADDTQYQIGDKWIFRIETIMDDDRVFEQSYTVSIGVSTRYAGKYKAIAAEYYRLGVLTYTTADWPEETIIESVDATTYKVIKYLGAFENTTSPPEWFFTIVGDKITYPTGQTANGQPFISCVSNPNDFAPLVCDENTDIVINDDVNGKDRLVMTFGYYTGGSGPRVFHQVMEKIVE